MTVSKQLDMFLKARRGGVGWSEGCEPLAELASVIAAEIDAGVLNAQLVRELRLIIAELMPKEVDDGGFDSIYDKLRTAVRHS